MATRTAQPCERVLVMNDSEDMLAAIRDVLEFGGAQVVTATSREAALRALEGGFEPSVFLLDVRLGDGGSGDGFAASLRASARYARTPIVLISGDVQELGRVEHVADRVLVKPFAIENLFEVLSELCAPR